MEEKVVTIINEMAEYLNVSQMKKLQEVLLKTFSEHEATKKEVEGMPEEKKERIERIKGSLVSGPTYVFEDEEDGKIYWKLMYE